MQKILSLLGIFFLFIMVILTLIILVVDLNIFNVKKIIYSNYPNLKVRTELFNKKSIMNNLNNDYNIKFLPYSQFEKFNYEKKKIIFENNLILKSKKIEKSISYKRYNSFFIDYFEDKIFITDYLGNVYFFDQRNLFLKKESVFAKNIKNNLRTSRVFDAFIHDNKIFVSYTFVKNGCNTINISFAKLNYEELNFKNFYNPKVCNKTGSPGRIQHYKFQNNDGLLISTSEGIHDKPGQNSQKTNSIFGKILFVPFNGEKELIFSSGHRVIQGLNVSDQKILSTEHGPRGGDEINLILNNGNYGWPNVSLGERYDFNYQDKKIAYKKDHKNNNFNEPVFSFIPSIGISEIIKLPKSFSIFYEDHYIITSLNGGSIFLTRFDEKLNKVLTIEKVFLNNRIRDIKYLNNFESIILALEENGEIGVLSKIN
tara:strand:+ start:124 stop:1404 length:1281 start_codon:yes stop_codon:yes gene_type:complete